MKFRKLTQVGLGIAFFGFATWVAVRMAQGFLQLSTNLRLLASPLGQGFTK